MKRTDGKQDTATRPGDPGPKEGGDGGHLRYLLTAYLFENISEDGRREVEAHLAECESCRAELEDLRRTRALLEDTLGGDTAGYAFDERRRERVLATARDRRHRWLFGLPWAAKAAAVLLVAGTAITVVAMLVTPTFLGDRERADRIARVEYYEDANGPSAGALAPRLPELALEEDVAGGAGERTGVGSYRTAPGQPAIESAPAVTPPGDANVKARTWSALESVAGEDGAASTVDDRVLRDGGTDPFASGVAPARPRGAELNQATNVELAEGYESGAVAGADSVPVLGDKPVLGSELNERARVDVYSLNNRVETKNAEAPPAAEPAAVAGVPATPGTPPPASRSSAARVAAREGREDDGLGRQVAGGRTLALGGTPAQQKPADPGGPPGVTAATRELAAAGHGVQPEVEEEAESREAGDKAALWYRAPVARDTKKAPERLLRDFEAGGKLSVSDLDALGKEVAQQQEQQQRLQQLVEDGDVLVEKRESELARSEVTAEPLGDEAAPEKDALDLQARARGRFNRVPGADAAEADVTDTGGASELKLLIDLPHDAGAGAADATADTLDALGAQDLEAGEAEQFGDVAEIPVDGSTTLYLGGLTLDEGEELSTTEEVQGLVGNVTEWGVYAPDSSRPADGETGGVQGWSFSIPKTDRYAKRLDPGKGGGGGGGAARGLAVADGKLVVVAEPLLRAYFAHREVSPELTLENFLARPLPAPPPEVGDEGLGEAEFRRLHGTNPFVDTTRDHLSTFSMDVDTASWTMAVEALRSGRLPEPRTVRVEEFVNSFRQPYPTDPEEAFSVLADGMPSPFGAPGVELLRIGIRARELRAGERRPAVLTLAIDVSGSMADSADGGPTRLDLVKDALALLMAQLEPTDRVAVVTYSSEAHVVLPHTLARHGERVRGALATLSPRGGTNMEAGLDLAYRIASEVLSPGAVHRVILVSDGVANLGARDPEELLGRIDVYKRRGIYLSVIGIGRRVRDDMLERLSNAGNGTYDFIRSGSVPEAREDAARIFAANLPGAIEVLAEDAKIQVDFDPETVSHYRLLGYENRDIRDEDFRNDRIDAAEVGPGTTVTALYEVVRRPASTGALGKVFLRWRDAATRQIVERDYPIPAGVLSADVRSASFSLRHLAAVAECAELLRKSYYARDGSFAAVLAYLARFPAEERARPEWQESQAFARLAYAAAMQELGREIANVRSDEGKVDK